MDQHHVIDPDYMNDELTEIKIKKIKAKQATIEDPTVNKPLGPG